MSGERQPKVTLNVERTLLAVYVVAALAVVVADAIWRNPTEAAAIGTVAALGVIAYQSWQTRLATASAQQGLAMAEQSVRVSQAVAVEAEKTRLDQRGPHIAIERRPVYWPPFGKSPYGHGLAPGQLSEGMIFRMPGQGKEPFVLRADGTVRNEGQWSVRVHFTNAVLQLPPPPNHDPDDEPLWESPRPQGFERYVAPGESVPFRVEEALTVEAWVTNGRARLIGEKPPTAIHAEIIVSDDFDNGVVDNYLVEIGGYPLDPVQGETDSWVIPACFPHNVPIHFRVFAHTRQYFQSKRDERRLPVIDPAPERT